MSYRTIKDTIVQLLGELGYRESNTSFDIENISANELNHRFIISVLSGEADEDSQRINTRLYDNQIWRIQIGFNKTENNDIVIRDDMYARIENIVKKLDDPDNYEGITNGVTTQRYLSWEVESFDNYYVLSILVKIQDRYTY